MPNRTAQNASAFVGGFDFSDAMRGVVGDMVGRLPNELGHIQLEFVCVTFASTRRPGPFGIQASLTPLRFPGGAVEGIRRGRKYRVQRVLDQQQREMRYVLTFYLPRFMELPFREKLITILHELWHISPAFDGDIRRHAGRCFAHTHSQKEYDAEMGVLADRWLALNPPAPTHDFLRLDFKQLWHARGPLYGWRVPRPKLIPVA